MTEIKPEQIPEVVREAFDEADNGCDCRDCKAKAIAAAINAWPGMSQWVIPDNKGEFPSLILPLPEQERPFNED